MIWLQGNEGWLGDRSQMSVSWCYQPGQWHVGVDGSQISLLSMLSKGEMAHHRSMTCEGTSSQICLPLHVIDQVDDMWGSQLTNMSPSPCHQPGQWHVRRAKLTNISPSACHRPGQWHVWEGRQLTIRPPLHVINQVNDMCGGGRQARNRSPLWVHFFLSSTCNQPDQITSVGVAFYFLSYVGDCCWSVLGALCNPLKP